MFDRMTCYLYDTAIIIKLKTVIRTECIDTSDEHKNQSDTKNNMLLILYAITLGSFY